MRGQNVGELVGYPHAPATSSISGGPVVTGGRGNPSATVIVDLDKQGVGCGPAPDASGRAAVFQGVGGDLVDRYHDVVGVMIAQTAGDAPGAQPPA